MQLLPPNGVCDRSRGLRRAVLEKELSGDTAAGAIEVRGLERAVLDRERERERSLHIAARVYRSMGL